jgi:peptide deformylase
MALLPILEFPDPRLRTVAKPVAEVTDEIRQLVKDLLVLDISEDQSKPQVFINPTFEPISAETKAYDEGCLSIPGFYESVERPDLIRVSALDLQGQPQTTEADGLLSVCIQHELDHLDGKLFVDYISALKRNRIKAKLEKLHKSRD